MLNSRKQPSKIKGGIHVNQYFTKGASETDILRVYWVDRFLAPNSQFWKCYTQYKEQACKVASNNKEAQPHFLKLLANLVQRHSIIPKDIWNNDEKVIIMV